MLYNRIRQLLDILKSEGLDEIEVRSMWRSIRIVKRSATSMPAGTVDREADAEKTGSASPAADSRTDIIAGEPASPEVPSALESGERETPAEALSAAEAEGKNIDDNYEEIDSPMVGTFYASPNPESEPYVSPGQHVEVGQILCIIEAMKLMNEIEAERSGTIRKILVRDGQPVEFGQPLFLIESA